MTGVMPTPQAAGAHNRRPVPLLPKRAPHGHRLPLSGTRRRANATFEDPQAMLEACHDRVQRMCTLLERLTEHAGLHGADTQARQAATDVMRYFDLAGPHHHQDEEPTSSRPPRQR